jgi:DNA-binding response OmpR family regulator
MMRATRNQKSGPTVILALPDEPRTVTAVSRLRRAGWQVLRAVTPWDARRLACLRGADVVVLPTDGPDESGWLTCAKLRRARPRVRVVLIGERTPEAVRFARFVGAATLVPTDANAAQLSSAVAKSAGTVTV